MNLPLYTWRAYARIQKLILLERLDRIEDFEEFCGLRRYDVEALLLTLANCRHMYG